MVVGGERAGKSRWLAEEINARALWCRRVAVAAQEYDEARAEMRYIINGLERLRLLDSSSTPRYGKWSAITRTGLEIETVSLHDGPAELTARGEAYDVVALVEAGRIRYDALLAARGRVAETRGVVLLSGTLWDNFGWYADLYQSFQAPNPFEGQVFTFPSWLNRAIYPEGEQDPEIQNLKRILPDGEFARRVAAKLVPSPARVYPEFEFIAHVGIVPFDPDLPVELAVDPGYFPSKYAVLALQVWDEVFMTVGGSVYTMEVVRQIDEIWENHLTHHDVVDLCRGREWWRNVTVAVGGHETKQHQAAKSAQEVWTELVGQMPGDPEQFRFEVFDAGRILDGVTRVRTFLEDPATKEPRYKCDAGCVGTQREFQAYRRREDSRGNVVSDEPVDENNDAMDALRNYLVWRFGLVETMPRRPTPGRKRARMRG